MKKERLVPEGAEVAVGVSSRYIPWTTRLGRVGTRPGAPLPCGAPPGEVGRPSSWGRP